MTARGRARIRVWLFRYGPAELGGVTLAFAASFAVRRWTGNAVLAAYAAAWAETVGYVSVMVIRDLLSELRAARARGEKPHIRHAGEVATGLLAEFGPAGVIDTFVTRPFMMGAGVRLCGPVLGIIAGKLSADVLFYGPVIYMYEWRVRRRARLARTSSLSSQLPLHRRPPIRDDDDVGTA
jgi:hypothetical protein